MGVTNLDQIAAAEVDAAALKRGGVAVNPYSYETIHFFVAGGQTVGAKKDAAIIGKAGTVVDIRAYADTAPVGAAMIVDVNKNGTTVFTTQAARPTIADGANASTTTLPAVTSVAAGDRLSIDVDQIGSGTAGSDLSVSITLRRQHATS